MAELVLESPSRFDARARADILVKFFQHQLDASFVGSIKDDVNFPSRKHHELRLELFRALAADGSDRERILKAWQEVFPHEEWFPSSATVKQAVRSQKPTQTA